MSSLVSAKGPSTIPTRLPPEYLIRAPLELDWRPARSSSTPAFISSSLYLAMRERSSSLGITPASDSLLAFTIILNFMLFLLGIFHGTFKTRMFKLFLRYCARDRLRTGD